MPDRKNAEVSKMSNYRSISVAPSFSMVSEKRVLLLYVIDSVYASPNVYLILFADYTNTFISNRDLTTLIRLWNHELKL